MNLIMYMLAGRTALWLVFFTYQEIQTFSDNQGKGDEKSFVIDVSFLTHDPSPSVMLPPFTSCSL